MNQRELQLKCRPIERPGRKAIKWQRGQSLVEAALSITLLIILFSGVVDLGRAFYVKIALDSAVGEGAHYASIFPDCVKTANQVDTSGSVNCAGTNSIWGRIVNENLDLNSSQMGQVTITDITDYPTVTDYTDTSTAPTTDRTIQIDASYDVNMLTPFIQGVFGKTLTISASVKQTVRSSGSVGYPGTSLGAQPTSLTCTSAASNTMTWVKPSTNPGSAITQYIVYDVTGAALNTAPINNYTTESFTGFTPALIANHYYYIYAATSSGIRVGYQSAKVKCGP